MNVHLPNIKKIVKRKIQGSVDAPDVGLDNAKLSHTEL